VALNYFNVVTFDGFSRYRSMIAPVAADNCDMKYRSDQSKEGEYRKTEY